MTKVGPFFWIDNKLIYNALPIEKAELRGDNDKLDNGYSHDKLYDTVYSKGEYIDFLRGRVVWDIINNRSIIYIDKCIFQDSILAEIITAFEIGDYVTEFDLHYHCKNCVADIWND